MFLKLKLFTCITLISTIGIAQSKKVPFYQYTVDLTNVVDDKVYVELATPNVNTPEITFSLPKIIPGTYSIADYGRFISDFKAYDKKGNTLPVEKVNDNTWKITNTEKLQKISYWVEDIIDTELSGAEIYPMAATNIEEGKNFVLNTSGFFGYFEGMKQIPFTFNVIRQKDFYGSTGLIAQKTGEPVTKFTKERGPSNDTKRVDTYSVADYDNLIDSPLMYSKADTAIIKVGNTEVLIGSYSPTGKITAKEIANSVREVLLAQKEYLGGTLPVEKYAFIFYFTEKPIFSYGALEHSYSSFYYMPERTISEMKQQLRDFAAHEFFHIVTPLTIHSEEIHNFDFNDPKMSKHLWLYEGVTEYFAGNVQVKYNLITPEEYLGILRQKMVTASQFIDDVPFTDISKYTLDQYQDQYYNVYQKGALIGMCLDINLRKLSGGKYGMQNLVTDLSKRFGKTKAFQDDLLFDEITSLTYPEIGDFLKRYVGGSEKLPFQNTLEMVGVNFYPELINLELSLGLENKAISVTQLNKIPMLTVGKSEELNEQGKALKFLDGDILIKINAEPIPDLGPALGDFFERQQKNLVEGGKLSYTVLRKNEFGDHEEVELSASVKKVERKKKFVLTFNEDATPNQLSLRKSWLSPQ